MYIQLQIIFYILQQGGEIMNNKITKENKENPRYGDIWMCCLEEGNGSVQGGYRPVYVASNDMNNMHSTTLNIIPITSKSKKDLPIHVNLDCSEENGLTSQSTMLIEQIMTVSSSALRRKIGRITDGKTLQRISNAMSIQFPNVAFSK